MSNENFTLNDLNKIGDANLAEQGEASVNVKSTKVTVDDMVSMGVVKPTERPEPTEADNMIAKTFSEENIIKIAKERGERIAAEIEEKQMEQNLETDYVEAETAKEVDPLNEEEFIDEIEDSSDDEFEKEVLEIDESSNVVQFESASDTSKSDIVEDSSVEEDETTMKTALESNVESLGTEKAVGVDYDAEMAALDDEVNSNSDDGSESLKKLTKILQDKFVNEDKVVDFSNFTVSNKPVSASALIAGEAKTKRAATWALMHSEIPVVTTELMGDEIDILSSIFEMRSEYVTVNDLMRGYELMYAHTISDKGDSCLSFIKSISYYDLNHWFFSLYNANFSGSNYIPYNCQADSHVFLSDSMPMSSMIKFKDKAAEKKFSEVMAKDPNVKYSATRLYTSEITPISSKFAVAFKEPSIYCMTIEPTIITDRQFREKHASMISFLPYIDKLYSIDYENQTFRPIKYKEYPNDRVKDLKSKILTYERIINNIPTDDYSKFIGSIDKFRTDIPEEITYQVPATTCTKCGATIEASSMTAANLLFTRHRLPLIANTSVN